MVTILYCSHFRVYCNVCTREFCSSYHCYCYSAEQNTVEKKEWKMKITTFIGIDREGVMFDGRPVYAGETPNCLHNDDWLPNGAKRCIKWKLVENSVAERSKYRKKERGKRSTATHTHTHSHMLNKLHGYHCVLYTHIIVIPFSHCNTHFWLHKTHIIYPLTDLFLVMWPHSRHFLLLFICL